MNDQDPNRLTYDDILERLPAFVVGALDPDEMLAVEEYIHARPDLMARVHELEAAAAKLAYAAPTRPLPKSLQAKVMNRARASLPARPQSTAVARPERPAQPGRMAQPARRSGWLEQIVAWGRSRGWFALGLVGTAAAALVLGILLRQASANVDELRRQVQDLEQRVADIQAENSALEVENLQLQSELETRQNQLASLAGATQLVALGGTEAAPGASGTLYVRDGEGTLVLSNLEPLSAEQIYQLWLIPTDGAPPIPAGLLDHGGEPLATITLDLPATLDGIAAVGISIEPPGGSATPTGPIVLLGEKA
jgi:anti-sigma-K factor RskA